MRPFILTLVLCSTAFAASVNPAVSNWTAEDVAQLIHMNRVRLDPQLVGSEMLIGTSVMLYGMPVVDLAMCAKEFKALKATHPLFTAGPAPQSCLGTRPLPATQ